MANEDLKKLIDDLVLEKSLSFDVMDQVRKIKEQSDNLITENSALKAQVDSNSKSIIEKDNKIAELNVTIDDWKKRESSLFTRETIVLDVEHKNQIEQLKATHANETLIQVKEVIGMVFKNTVLRESVNRSVSVPIESNHYLSQGNDTEHKETEKT